EISRRLKVSRNTVRAIIKHGGAMPDTVRDDKINIDSELLSRLYTDCSGFIQRIYEKLREEEGISVGYSTETNFFPGRKFEDMEDLNRQAIEWATVRIANRPVSRTVLIPARAFEHEQAYLTGLPPYIPPPYLTHRRGNDQYGYVSFDGNFYWVPDGAGNEVSVLQYSNSLKIYHKRILLVEYPLPPDGVKNRSFSPQGVPRPGHQPKNRKHPTAQEEKKLRAAAVVCQEADRLNSNSR
ncbi:MAG TPA: hypothetical protein DCR39_00555, partial [Nitrospiraceae bacterium]|nr:hypothetical protein [Nitrospiraceae bacterium]